MSTMMTMTTPHSNQKFGPKPISTQCHFTKAYHIYCKYLIYLIYFKSEFFLPEINCYRRGFGHFGADVLSFLIGNNHSSDFWRVAILLCNDFVIGKKNKRVTDTKSVGNKLQHR